MTLWDRIRDKILATLRTAVAAAVGTFLTWLAVEHNVVLDEETSLALMALAGGLATAGYHAGASWVQRQWPQVAARWPLLGKLVGWLVPLLLGSAQQPSYRPRATSGGSV